uniref:Uncharacterized protein n=1 Tax=Myotis myotis TaxID=51298 RepID=A0A7J7RKJ2_MYOMY|nr:hypothetical protein mMyoMyo1_010299 [Myotis myotis]
MTHTVHQGADAQCRSCPRWSVCSHRGSSAQPQARLTAASTAVMAGASPASSAVLRISDCSLGLVPAGKWTSPRVPRLPEGCLMASLGPIPRRVGLSQQVDIPQGIPDCKRAQARLSTRPLVSTIKIKVKKEKICAQHFHGGFSLKIDHFSYFLILSNET